MDSEEVLSENASSTSDIEYIDDDDIFLETDEDCEKNEAKVEKYSFQVLSTEEIVKDMIDRIKEVHLIIEMPVTVIRILLNHFNWDKHSFMEGYYDENDENVDKLFKEAGIMYPYRLNLQKDTNANGCSSNSSKCGENSTEYCDICFTTVLMPEMAGLECDHRFCIDCWNEYLKTKIIDEGNSQTITCAAHGCDILVDDATVMRLLKEPEVRLKYQHLITNSFVEYNELLRWCPGVDCNHAIKVEYVDMKPVTCKCNRTFCMACGYNWHEPINCKLLQKWLTKSKDDSETSNWVEANTQNCPKCKTSIEKNGGCNYIRCQKCLHQFCWICMSPWSEHPNSWNQCNKYVETDSDIELRSNKEKVQTSLNRYNFYSNRYMNHLKSLELEKQLNILVQKKMEELQQHMSSTEVQFLKVALDVLNKCRQTLMYTYAFAFYLKKNNQSELFEINQRDLEFTTETLSGYLERDVDVENVVDMKQQVLDLYMYCISRRKVLLEHVSEGYYKDTWEYLDL